jgi:hypothetical protein
LFRNPGINIYSHDVTRLVAFYEGLGFRETFRTPNDSAPDHVEVTLDELTIGIASVDAARADHGLDPDLGGRPVEILLGRTTPTATTRALRMPVRLRSVRRTTGLPTFASRGSRIQTAIRSSSLRSASPRYGVATAG